MSKSFILTFVDSYGLQSWARSYGETAENALNEHLRRHAHPQYVGMEAIARPEFSNTGLERFRIGQQPVPTHALTSVAL